MTRRLQQRRSGSWVPRANLKSRPAVERGSSLHARDRADGPGFAWNLNGGNLNRGITIASTAMSIASWSKRFTHQLRRRNPFTGDIVPSRVRLLGAGRPSLPFPHWGNYREPIRILECFWAEAEGEEGSSRHNRFLDVPGFAPVLVTREPAVIKAVLSASGDKPGQFDRDTLPATGIARATGRDTMLYANGPLWRHQKKLASASFAQSTLFQPERFHEFEETFRGTVHRRLEAIAQRQIGTGERLIRTDIESEISLVMLEMLINNFFGGEVRYEELHSRYVPAMTLLIDDMVTDTMRPAPVSALARRQPALRQAQLDFEELTDIALSGRATNRALWQRFQSDAPDEALRSNVRVFLAGALEATTSFAAWAISHLARAPEVQERIYAEASQVDSYDPDALGQATTLRLALEETLRLTPSLYFLPRRAAVDTKVETDDGRTLVVPQGTHVVLDVWHSNRCEEFWGEEQSGYPATTFAPDRWSVLAEKGRSPKEMLHFGFGYGPRVCPGRSLGILEVSLVVGAFVKLFRFTGVGGNVTAKAGVSTKPGDGVQLDLETR